ncbi:MAG: response regulator transcription factor [Actinomycetia bacterium]|nr:response regulator transcription factor [Actinomycetes bacterium]
MAEDPSPRTSDSAIAVGIIDPDEARSDRLAAVLAADPATMVVQVASTLDAGPLMWSAPELVILGATGTPATSAELCRAIDDLLPACRVAIADAAGAEAVSAITAGAHTQLDSSADARRLSELMTGTIRGESEIGAETAAAILAHLTDPGDLLQPSAMVTETEREVLIRLGRGDSYDMVADAHNVTARLVRLYMGYAVAKHQRRSREESRTSRPVGVAG